jgi:hypothetical protein
MSSPTPENSPIGVQHSFGVGFSRVFLFFFLLIGLLGFGADQKRWWGVIRGATFAEEINRTGLLYCLEGESGKSRRVQSAQTKHSGRQEEQVPLRRARENRTDLTIRQHMVGCFGVVVASLNERYMLAMAQKRVTTWLQVPQRPRCTFTVRQQQQQQQNSTS